MQHTPSASTTLTVGLAIALAMLGHGTRAEAGPFTVPTGAPPLANPLPPVVPAIGSTFTPPPLVPEQICVPVCTLWEVGVGRLGPGNWVPDDPVVIQDSPFRDQLHFRVPLNNVPPPGALPPWSLFISFGANPWGFAAPFAFQMTSLSPFFTTPAIPEPFAIGTWAYTLVLTNSAGVVIDALDPVLVTGSTLAPTVPGRTVPEPATLALVGGGMIALAMRLSHGRRARDRVRSKGD
jgi:hypothetical protein